MIKNFILSYDLSSRVFTNEQLLAFIGENRVIQQWLNPFPGLIIIKSNAKASDLRQSISKFISVGYYVVAELEVYETAGALTNEMWDWFNTGVLPESEVREISKIRSSRNSALSYPRGDV